MAQQPLLALQVKPVQTPTYGDIMQERDAYRTQQNALAQQQMKQQQNAMLNQAYRAAYDPQTGRVDQAKLYGSLAEGGMGAEIPGQTKALGKGVEASGKGGAAQVKYAQELLAFSRNELGSAQTPQEAMAAGARIAQQFPEAAPNVQQQIAQLQNMTPEQFGAWKMDALRKNLSAEQRLKQHFQTQNLGGSTRVLAMPEYGGGGAAVVPGSEAEVTMSPAQANPAGRVVQDAEGNYFVVNPRTGGAAPVRPGGGGIPGERGGGFDTEAFKAAVVQQESGGDYTVVSPKGALGAYQVMPATAKTLAERLGLPWNPGLMRSNTAEGRQYQDAIGAAAISEAVQASGGDPARAAAYYHGGSDTGKWGPKTQAYAQAVTANMSRSDGGQLRGVPKGGKAATTAPAGKLTQAEQTASYNINRVLQAAAEIRRVTAKNPAANAPGAVEAFVSGTPLLNRGANFTRSADRQIVAAAQRDMLDGLLYLATGAAYNKEQLEGQMESYIPAYSDEPATVKSKRDRLANLVAAAKTRAGNAWSPQMDASLRALTGAAAPAPTGGAPKRLKYNPATGGFD
jgi:hypothetical protein